MTSYQQLRHCSLCCYDVTVAAVAATTWVAAATECSANRERQMCDRCVAKGASAEGAIVADGLALKALVIVMRRSAK